MHKALIGVVGPSGSGKSTSLRNLEIGTTEILDLERKGFPFKIHKDLRVTPCDNVGQFDASLRKAVDNKANKVIVIESFAKYIEMLHRMASQAYKGYDIWNYYNKQIGVTLDTVKNDHAVVVFTAIDEIVRIPQVDGSEMAQRRIKVQGKQWEGLIEKEFLMVLFTDVRKNKEGNMIYQFQTNTDGTTTAKTPMGMFKEQFVPNDLSEIIKAAQIYYEA